MSENDITQKVWENQTQTFGPQVLNLTRDINDKYCHIRKPYSKSISLLERRLRRQMYTMLFEDRLLSTFYACKKSYDLVNT